MTARRLLALLLTLTLALTMPACDDHGHEKDHDHKDEKKGGHAHEPSHGGKLIEVGDHEANIEVKLDDASGTLDVWTSGPHAVKAARIDAMMLNATLTIGDDSFEMSLGPVANEITDEKAGDTSHFQGQDDRLKGVKKFTIEVKNLKILGKTHESVKGEIDQSGS